jgi:hypothetical protein
MNVDFRLIHAVHANLGNRIIEVVSWAIPQQLLTQSQNTTRHDTTLSKTERHFPCGPHHLVSADVVRPTQSPVRHLLLAERGSEKAGTTNCPLGLSDCLTACRRALYNFGHLCTETTPYWGVQNWGATISGILKCTWFTVKTLCNGNGTWELS